MPRDRLKIAFVIDDLGFGGAQHQLSILAGALTDFVEPLVFCLSSVSHPFAARLKERQIPVTEFERRSNFDLVRLRSLYGALSRERVDVVHGILDAANIYSFLAARKTGLPIVLSLRSDRLRLGGMKAVILRYALRKADRVVVNSKAGRRYLTDTIKVRPERIALIRNAASVPPERPPRPEEPDVESPVIGFVGRLSPEKNLDLLVEAFARLRERQREVRLILIGDGPERDRVAALVNDKRLGEFVEMPGMVEDAAAHIARFSCLVLPSVYEGSPNVVLEALAAGVPVIAGPVGDLEEIVVDGRTGFIMRERSAVALASLTERALSDDSMRRRASVEGPRIVREKFSATTAVEKLNELYRSLVDR
jgi:glycosyltransferase involved in cell wall biosynthesis